MTASPRPTVGLRAAEPLAAAALTVVLAGCAAGTSRVEACVEHAVEEGVDRGRAQEACEAAVADG